MVHTNHLPLIQYIHYYRRRREAPYTLSPKATPDAKPSHAIGTATNANKGNMQIPPFFKLFTILSSINHQCHQAPLLALRLQPLLLKVTYNPSLILQFTPL